MSCSGQWALSPLQCQGARSPVRMWSEARGTGCGARQCWGEKEGWLAWMSQDCWSRDKPPTSPQPAYKGKWISGSLSIRLSYELSDLWDVYMNQKMCYLMKIASFNILAWQAKNCTSLGESARVNDFFFPKSLDMFILTLPSKEQKNSFGVWWAVCHWAVDPGRPRNIHFHCIIQRQPHSTYTLGCELSNWRL